MSEILVLRDQFTVTIRCPKCKRAGDAIWEEAVESGPQGPKPTLISLPDGFIQRMRRNLASLPEVVCEGCGAVVPD